MHFREYLAKSEDTHHEYNMGEKRVATEQYQRMLQNILQCMELCPTTRIFWVQHSNNTELREKASMGFIPFLKTNNTFFSSLLYHLPSLTYQYTQMYTYTQWYLNSSFLLQLSHCITDFPNSNSLLSDFPKANPQLLVILMYSIFRMMLIFSFFFN